MKLFSLVRNSLFIAAVILLLVAPRASAQQSQPQAQASSSSLAQTSAVPSRITQAIDETQFVRLKGNVHPLARPEFDQGPVSDAMPVTRALLLLQRSPDQEAALRQLLNDQQTKDSLNFHQWLSPQQFGAQFGPADADIQTLTQWLTSQGFLDVKVGPGRTTIEFSGTVRQIRDAFHTEIHQFNVNGQMHLANASDPQIPAALSPVIAGVVGLHDFRAKSLSHRAKNFHPETSSLVRNGPEVTLSGCGASGTSPCYVVAPADFAKIYNVPSMVGGNPAGLGVPIAIVQDSNVNLSDIQQFRTLFGLTGGAFNVILNGPDPGVQGDEVEADLDSEWSGAVAPGATIDLVVTESPQTLGAQGIDLSADYIIENNLAPIMSVSFGACETATQVNAFYSALWEQASAEGITVAVATGDSGSDVCDAISLTNDFATTGLSISGIASTPFNVALGGTDFQNGTPPSVYWSTPGTNTESAKSYIPESTWNSSCAAGATSATLNSVCTPTIISQDSQTLLDISAGSGGQSAISTNVKPAWQSGVTADTLRDIPDISLFSAVNTNSNSFYLMCEADSPSQNGNPCSLTGTISISGIGGTSAAAPAFAGIMAMVVQQQGGEPKGRQGNANFALYQLYKNNMGSASKVCASDAANVSTNTCIFYDVITGNNSVACQANSLNCSNKTAGQYGVLVDPASTTTPAYTAVAGYDKATGLGSVNVGNLLTAWTSASFSADTTTITSSPSAPIAHGTSANFTVTVAQASGAVVPTGFVSLIATPSGGTPLGIGAFNNNTPLALSNGSVTISTNLLPGGSDSVVAQYSGDTNFAASQSAAVNVTVNPESSKTAVTLVGPTGNSTPYGSPYILRVDVTNNAGQQCATFAMVLPCPTGQVSMTDNGSPLNDFSGTNKTNLPIDLGFLEDQFIQLPVGSHSIVATYAGDTSYSGSTSTPPLALTITQATTLTAVGASPSSGVTTTTPVTLTATISSTSNSSAGPTGNVMFKDGTITIGTIPVVPAAATATAGAGGTAILTLTFLTAGTHTITASYAGDTNYAASSTPAGVTVTVTTTGVATTTTLTGSPTNLPAGGGSVTLTATVTGTAGGATPTGTVTFNNGTTALGTPVTCVAGVGGAGTCKAALTVTLSFLAPPPGPHPIPNNRIPPVVLIVPVLLILLLFNLRRIPAPYRRAYTCLCFLLLVSLAAGIAGCGGGYGGGGGGGGGVHYDYITAAYSGDATYASSTSAQVTITIQ